MNRMRVKTPALDRVIVHQLFKHWLVAGLFKSLPDGPLRVRNLPFSDVEEWLILRARGRSNASQEDQSKKGKYKGDGGAQAHLASCESCALSRRVHRRLSLFLRMGSVKQHVGY